MKIEDAKAAAAIAAQIEGLTAVVAQIDVAIKEGWPVSSLKVSAPPEGSSQPAGTTIDLLPMGKANAENSALALKTARETYQGKLDELTAALAAL